MAEYIVTLCKLQIMNNYDGPQFLLPYILRNHAILCNGVLACLSGLELSHHMLHAQGQNGAKVRARTGGKWQGEGMQGRQMAQMQAPVSKAAGEASSKKQGTGWEGGQTPLGDRKQKG